MTPATLKSLKTLLPKYILITLPSVLVLHMVGRRVWGEGYNLGEYDLLSNCLTELNSEFRMRFFLIGNIECSSSYLSESEERSAHNFMISTN